LCDVLGLSEIIIENISVDQRKPLRTLKGLVSNLIGLTVDQFSVHRLGSRLALNSSNSEAASNGITMSTISPGVFTTLAGQELKDLDCTVLDCSLVERGGLQILHRPPLLPHEYRLNVYVQVPLDLLDVKGCLFSEQSMLKFIDMHSAGTLTSSSEEVPAQLWLVNDNCVVSKLDAVGQIKQKLFRAHVWDMLKPAVRQQWVVNEDPAALPLRLRAAVVASQQQLPEMSPSPHTGQQQLKLAHVLRDADNAIIGESFKPLMLVDGHRIVLQVGVHCVGALGPDHAMVQLRRWNCIDNVLELPVEVALDKRLTFQDLHSLIASTYWQPQDRNDVSELLLAKPFAWQLKDLTTLPTLKWTQQPKPDDILGQAPWRLADNAIIVYVSATEYHTTFGNGSGNSENTETRVKFDATPEVGFRIYSLQEQLKRSAEEKKDREERKQLIASKMEAMVTHFASNNQI
jgi:hypothetical protein